MTQSIPLHTILIPWASDLHVRSRLPQRSRLEAYPRFLRAHGSAALLAYSSAEDRRRDEQRHEFWAAVRRFHLREAARAKFQQERA